MPNKTSAPNKISAIFIDRDGTLNEEVGYLSRPEDVVLIPGAPEALARLNAMGIPVIVITNQSGIGKGKYTVQDFELTVKGKIQKLQGLYNVAEDIAKVDQDVQFKFSMGRRDFFALNQMYYSDTYAAGGDIAQVTEAHTVPASSARSSAWIERHPRRSAVSFQFSGRRFTNSPRGSSGAASRKARSKRRLRPPLAQRTGVIPTSQRNAVRPMTMSSSP